MLCLTAAENVPMTMKLIFPQERARCVSDTAEGSWTFAKVPRNKGLRVACSPNFCLFAMFNKTGKGKNNFSLLKFESYILKQLETFLLIMS